MPEARNIIHSIFKIASSIDFEKVAIQLFHYQYKHVKIYRDYCNLLKVKAENIFKAEEIPFLPISFFKTHRILNDKAEASLVFKSSGTGNQTIRSEHHVADSSIYETGLLKAFTLFAGHPSETVFFSLLPGYESNNQSSLIYMIDTLAKFSSNGEIQSYPNDPEKFIQKLLKLNKKGIKNTVFGVSHALLDLSEKSELQLPFTTLIETGGMKGRRKEITRTELHEKLNAKLKPANIISEYGMTELLSQAYAVNSEWFSTPPWLKVFIRDTDDPFNIKLSGSGAVNVIDLANVYSCAFIATDDLAVLKESGKFSVIGRFDHSDIRGCNLLYTD